MLAHIHIRNIGIIEDLEIDFDKGLNILTGETGAGKTLILGAIQMICGGKVSRDLIRNGADKAFAEALFYVEDLRLKKVLSDMGYEGDEIVISRELSNSGRSVAKVNGRLVSVNELRELGKVLVDLHGQHDNQSLLDPKNHIEVIDNFAGAELGGLKSKYTELYNRRKEILVDIERLGGNPEQRIRTMEFLKFQIDEISSANLKENEDEELSEKRKVMANAEKIIHNLSYSYEAFSDENGVLNTLEKVRSRLEEISGIDNKYEKLLETVNEAYYQIEDLKSEISSETERVFVDEDELNKIDERLDLIFKLKKKYGRTISDILRSYDDMNKEYLELCNSEEMVSKLNHDLVEVEKSLKSVALEISAVRRRVSDELQVKLADILKDMEMPKAKFSIKVEATKDFLKNGMDDVEILFSSNLGEDVKPLSKVASGGEISRIMLSLKNVLANADIIPVMIFDEIDTGISGKAGFAVGEKMAEIAKDKQVICVTHLPSIAACGNQNYYICKNSVGDKTVTSVKKLNEEETIHEIARIISGGNISETALLHAKEIRGAKSAV